MYERFIARQPKFDYRLRVFVYELLFRSSARNVFQPRKDASGTLIVDSTMLLDFHMPMHEVLSRLPLPADVRTALDGGNNRFRDIYDALLSYERADWNSVSSVSAKLGSPEDRIPGCYLAAASRAVTLPL
ncbi:MAG TPA: hypothetical protein VJN93_02015 [Candidatus Acidoferrum sp.]|nr:hypothetical protein [Candidatus Acidoferrum sp.]